MDSKEFNQGAKRTENSSSVIFDVRGFGARQGEATDSYLHDECGLRRATAEIGSRKVLQVLSNRIFPQIGTRE